MPLRWIRLTIGTTLFCALFACGQEGTSTSCDAVQTEGIELPASCAELESSYASELEQVVACERDADCGQVLEGTSCGCTRNLVLALDADPTRICAIQDWAVAQECEPLFMASTCDCPATRGFVCESGVCGWNYVQ